jgi:hypothetical protein
MAGLGGHEGGSEDMPMRLKDYPSFTSSFQTAGSPQHNAVAKAIGNVVMGLDNPSLLHVFGEGFHMVRS